MAQGGTDHRERDSDGLTATVRFAREAGGGITGLAWLVVLYALSLGSAFLILSATVFQTTTIQGSPDQAGKILKILRIIPERESLVIDQLDVTRNRVVDLKRQLSVQDGRLQRATLRLDAAAADLVVAVSDSGLPVAPDVLLADPRSDSDWRIRVASLRRDLEAAGEPGEAAVAAFDAVAAVLTDRAEAQRLFDASSVLLKLESQELDRLRRERDTIRESVFAANGIEPDAQANISQVLNTNFSLLLYLVQLPSEFLTFALTVSMGLLGSTIHMSRQLFANGGNRGVVITVTWFVARPLEGMAAAIIIYIFFRAGQLTLTGGSTADNKIDDLNPYVLSFLAIASGLLSEKAYNRIVVGARNVLGGGDTARRASGSATASDARSPVA